MTIALEHQTFRSTIDDANEAAVAIEEARRHIDREVDAVLATWRGLAADAFAEGWAEWRAGSDRVLDGLAAMAQLLDAVHDDLSGRDVDAAVALDQTSTSIVDRLG